MRITRAIAGAAKISTLPCWTRLRDAALQLATHIDDDADSHAIVRAETELKSAAIDYATEVAKNVAGMAMSAIRGRR